MFNFIIIIIIILGIFFSSENQNIAEKLLNYKSILLLLLAYILYSNMNMIVFFGAIIVAYLYKNNPETLFQLKNQIETQIQSFNIDDIIKDIKNKIM